MIHMHNVGMEASYPSARLLQFTLVKWLMDNIIMCVWGGVRASITWPIYLGQQQRGIEESPPPILCCLSLVTPTLDLSYHPPAFLIPPPHSELTPGQAQNKACLFGKQKSPCISVADLIRLGSFSFFLSSFYPFLPSSSLPPSQHSLCVFFPLSTITHPLTATSVLINIRATVIYIAKGISGRVRGKVRYEESTILHATSEETMGT